MAACSKSGRLSCLCLLIEGPGGLVLLDTGFGTQDLAHPVRNIGALWIPIMRPELDPAQTAIAQVRALGHDPADVRDIILTHLDFDHAGGLPDFPKARVHVSKLEHEEVRRVGPWKKRRYTPRQWAHGPEWKLYGEFGERWMGFDAVKPAVGLGDEVLLVPILGHSAGHCGVAIREGEGRGWLLHCGDAYFHHGEVDPDGNRGALGPRAYQLVYQHNHGQRLANQARLRELARNHGGEVHLISSHDLVYLTQDVHAPGEPSRPEVVTRNIGPMVRA